MACPAGCCGSCVFTKRVGDPEAKIESCTIKNDPEVDRSYSGKTVEMDDLYTTIFGNEKMHTYQYGGGVCAKYQLDPAALSD